MTADQVLVPVDRETVLAVRALEVQYATGRKVNTALRGVSVDVPKGGVLAVVGESGSGKSTLAHSIVRLLPRSARIVSGEVRLGSDEPLELTRLSDRRLRGIRGSRIGFVPQDPMSSLNPTQTIGRQVTEAATLHAASARHELTERVVRLLERAGLRQPASLLGKYPHELSGGMRQRVLIAMAFACSPELIIADEPTSALDASVSRHVLDNLQQMVADEGATLMIITHDLALAAQRATDVVVMSCGEVVEAGPAAAVFARPEAEYTRRLLGSSLHLTPRRPRSATHREHTGTDALVRLQGVSKVYREGAPPAVADLSLELRAGQTLALVGESGSGKSTTARMILGLEQPTAGSVTVFGQDVARLQHRERRALYRRMQVVYQSPFASLDPRFTIEQVVDEPLRAFRIGDRNERRARVRDLLDRVGLPAGFATRYPDQLSGGQRQRVAIARALAVSPEIVVCDEAVSALDATVQAQVLDLLREIQDDSGVAYLFITHDLAVVADMAHEVAVMQQGRVVEHGPVDRILSAPQHLYTIDLLDAAFPASPLSSKETTA